MQLSVFLNEIEVGTLERDADGRTALRFAESYLALRSRPVLGQYFVDKLRYALEQMHARLRAAPDSLLG